MEIVSILDKARDKEFWAGVRSNPDFKPLIDNQLENYEKYCKDDIPTLKYSEYRIYFDNGSRVEYQKAYFARRIRLATLALLCFIYPENEEYLEKLQDTIWAICDEYTWVLPAHGNGESTVDKYKLDLFSAETGFTLSEIYSIMGERFMPIVAERIKDEVNIRVIDSFINRRISCESWPNNWAAVCGGSIAATFMYMSPEKFSLIKPRIDAMMSVYLGSYMEDGVCLEGYTYWTYGFGFFVYYADMLKRFTNGEQDYFKDEKIKTMAMFQQNVYMRKNIIASFSNSNIENKFSIGLTYMLKSIYPDDFAIPCIDNDMASKSILSYGEICDGCGRFAPSLRAFLYYSAECDDFSNKIENTCYYKDSAWYFKKMKSFAFACKAGNNQEEHNHDDVGSFILTTDNGQMLCDIGSGVYSKEYFSTETRGNFINNNSFGHNVPIVNGKPQSEGTEFFGEMQQVAGGVKINFEKAYDDSSLKKLERVLLFENDTVTLKDSFEFEGDGELVERFVTNDKPEVIDGVVKFGDVEMSFDKDAWEFSCEAEDYQNHYGVPHILYKMDLKPIKKVSECEVNFKVII